MPAIYALDIYKVGVLAGSEANNAPARICLPYINVGLYIGNLDPLEWPPDYLRHSETGEVLLNEDGTPLMI